jgi:undecaprenyl-diphosphatase
MPGSDYLEAVILGVVQGIAEFLPISSSGHLVIVSELMQQLGRAPVDPSANLRMNVALHVGTLFSIVFVYFADLLKLIRQPRLMLAIITATVPVAVAGLILKDWFETVFQTPMFVGCSLLVTAALLVVGQRMERNKFSLDEISTPRALTIGVFQALALIPGISRSGSTIAAGLLVGFRREAAATFSFFIAIPAILGAAAVTVADLNNSPMNAESSAGVLLAAMLTSFAVGLVALRVLLNFVSQGKLHWFAVYCALAGIVTIGWQIVT